MSVSINPQQPLNLQGARLYLSQVFTSDCRRRLLHRVGSAIRSGLYLPIRSGLHCSGPCLFLCCFSILHDCNQFARAQTRLACNRVTCCRHSSWRRRVPLQQCPLWRVLLGELVTRIGNRAAQQRTAAEFDIPAESPLWANTIIFGQTPLLVPKPAQPPHHAVWLPRGPKIGETLDSLFFGR